MTDRLSPAATEGRRGDRIPTREPDLEPIREALRGLRYGEVRVVVQDGLIIQVDRLDKRRIR